MIAAAHSQITITIREHDEVNEVFSLTYRSLKISRYCFTVASKSL